MSTSFFPDQGLGVGLRPEHYPVLRESPPRSLGWVEALTENYLSWEGVPRPNSRKNLHSIRRNFPVALHGVSLSVGSAEGLNLAYLKSVKHLLDEIEPLWVSDHLCWTGTSSQNLHDLLPLPYTEEAIQTVVANVLRAQDFFKRRILIENLSSYVSFASSEMQEWEFLTEIARRADCGILLDVNNVYVSSVNHHFDPLDYLRAIPHERIGQIHLAGHSVEHGYLNDTHDAPVCDDVWELFRWTSRHLGLASTMVEWDANIPEFSVLEAEVLKAGSIRERERQRQSQISEQAQSQNGAPNAFPG